MNQANIPFCLMQEGRYMFSWKADQQNLGDPQDRSSIEMQLQLGKPQREHMLCPYSFT